MGQAQPIPRFESFSCGGLGMCVSHGFPREATSEISHPSQDGTVYFMELSLVAGQSLEPAGHVMEPGLLASAHVDPPGCTWQHTQARAQTVAGPPSPPLPRPLHCSGPGHPPEVKSRIQFLTHPMGVQHLSSGSHRLSLSWLYLDSHRQGRAPSTPLGVPQSRMPATIGLRSLPSVGRPAASCSQPCLS